MTTVKSILISFMLGAGTYLFCHPIFDSFNPPPPEKTGRWERNDHRNLVISTNRERALSISIAVFLISNVSFYMRPGLLNRSSNKEADNEESNND